MQQVWEPKKYLLKCLFFLVAKFCNSFFSRCFFKDTSANFSKDKIAGLKRIKGNWTLQKPCKFTQKYTPCK